ncbi:MAG: VOC family protein [Prevotellaceae bacterium]|jgi:uncharacterized glyoxalase superfamily protein PhnB|nr:VOC family protein [Prevotellaceae bacterium]
MEINKLTPNMAVADIRQTVKFYCDNLGFKLIVAIPESQDGAEQELSEGKEYVYAMLQKDHAELMFQRLDSFKEDVPSADKVSLVGASVSFYMQGNGIESFYEELKSKNIQVSELKQTWYGIKEFYLKDNNGYILCFAEDVKPAN